MLSYRFTLVSSRTFTVLVDKKYHSQVNLAIIRKVKPSQIVQYFPRVHEDGLESRRLGLSFTVDESHFLKGDLFLKCQATVAAIYSATEEEGATVFEGKPLILEQRENLIHVRSGSTSTQHPSTTYVFALTFLLFCIAPAEQRKGEGDLFRVVIIEIQPRGLMFFAVHLTLPFFTLKVTKKGTEV
ncbi:hypothetical protein SK128_001663 [Halocaridina rubra]|uniref:Uncharacterized protein n=1 Tax=Halocaridina rubra TaxID=373956 RepID=A0AAN8ZW91_HALRR